MKATGLRWLGGFAIGAAFLLGSALASPQARADEESAKLLQSAFDDYAAGKLDDALKKLTDYVAKNPGEDEIYGVLKNVDEQVKLRALASGGDHERLMRYLLDKARPTVEAKKRDPEAINALVEQALSGEIDVRRRADLELATRNGDYAVPYLLKPLADADAEKVVNAMFALHAIGSEAVLPLNQVVIHSGVARLRGYAAAVLGDIGDPRALPALRRAVEKDADDGVKAKAAKAVQKIRPDAAGGGVSAADSFVRLGERYLVNDPSILSEADQVHNLWAWEGEGLVRIEVPAALFAAHLAQNNAEEAMALKADHRGAKSLLVRSIVAQIVTGRAMGDKAPDALKGDASWNLAVSQGFLAASDALADALTGKVYDVAVECCALVAQTYGRQDLRGHPLGRALDAPERRVQYAAAIAALTMSPASPFENSARVPMLAAQAASEQSMRQVFVIDDHEDARARILQDLREAGYVVSGDRDGFRGVARLKGAPMIDVVVVRADLEAANQIPSEKWKSSLSVIDELTTDVRTKGMRVLVVADAAEKKEFLTAKYGDKISGYIDEPLVATGYVPTVKAAAEKTELNTERAATQKVAADAAAALAATNPCCTAWDYKVAVDPLAANVTDGATDDIKMNSIRALGNLRLGGGAGLANVLKGDAKEEMKVAAATALGQVLSRVPPAGDEVDALVAAAKAGGAVGSAALKALGMVMALPAEVRASVFGDHRLETGKKGE